LLNVEFWDRQALQKGGRRLQDEEF
jgi:hypothetical protein